MTTIFKTYTNGHYSLVYVKFRRYNHTRGNHCWWQFDKLAVTTNFIDKMPLL